MVEILAALAYFHGGCAAMFPISPDAFQFTRWVQGTPDLELVETESGKTRVQLIGCKFSPRTVLFSPDGRTVAASSTLGEVCLWSADTGRLIRRAEDADTGHGTFWVPLQYSPDGRSLAVGNLMPRPRSRVAAERGILSIWNAASGKERLEARIPVTGDVRQICFAHRGRTLRVAGGSIVDLDVRTGRIQGDGLPISSDSLSPDGRLAYAWAPGWITVWDVDARKRIVHERDTGSPRVGRVFFSPDDRSFGIFRNRLVISGDTGYTAVSAELWRISDGKRLWATDEIGPVEEKACFSPDGRKLLLSNGDLRDVLSGRVEAHCDPLKRPILDSHGVRYAGANGPMAVSTPPVSNVL